MFVPTSVLASTKCLGAPAAQQISRDTNNSKTWQKINDLVVKIPTETDKSIKGAQGEVRRTITLNGSPIVVKFYFKHADHTLERNVLLKVQGAPNVVEMRADGIVADGIRGYRLVIVLNNAGECDLLDFVNDKGKLSEGNTLLLILKILEALAELHARGVIHCDVKPENVIVRLSDNFEFTLGDLGLATITNNKKNEAENCIKGTLAYASPEFVLSSTEYDSGIDIWGLGLLTCMAQNVDILEFQSGESRLSLLHKMQKLFGPFPQEMIRKTPEKVRRECFEVVRGSVNSEGKKDLDDPDEIIYKLKEADFDWPSLEEIMEEKEFPESIRYLLRRIFKYKNRPTAKELLKEIISFRVQVPESLKKSTLTIESNEKLNSGVIQTIKKTVTLAQGVFQTSLKSQYDVYKIICKDSRGNELYKGHHVILDGGILAL